VEAEVPRGVSRFGGVGEVCLPLYIEFYIQIEKTLFFFYVVGSDTDRYGVLLSPIKKTEILYNTYCFGLFL
jgi:hypothetical protein